MEVRDPIHGSIDIKKEEESILFHPFFQRLRNIKQLGFSEFSFPGATHTRYIHALGVMHITGRIFDAIFPTAIQTSEHKRLKETLRLAGLLHDIGHAPLSHASESVMPSVSTLKLPSIFLSPSITRQATHEDYTIKAITDSSFTDSLKNVEKAFGVEHNHIASLITGQCLDPAYFTIGNTNYFSLLHQLVSSELDCDRMDYLLRDSHFTGVSYGIYDLDWIAQNLSMAVIDNHAHLGISERAVSSFDDFLLSRFHMFITVYFHYRAVCLEQMLFKFFQESPQEYTIPSSIEDYLEHDDHYLTKILRNSSNRWAKGIINNVVPDKIYESFENSDTRLSNIENFLNKKNIEYIKCSSKGRLSKYYQDQVDHPEAGDDHSIYVVKQYPADGQAYQKLSEATGLYTRYSQTHSITRIHCDFDHLSGNDQQAIKKILGSLK